MKIIDIIKHGTRVPGIVLWPGEAVCIRRHGTRWSSPSKLDVISHANGLTEIRVKGSGPYARRYIITLGGGVISLDGNG